MPLTILQHLSTTQPTIESYVLIRELRLFLALDQGASPPEVKVRIWLGNVLGHLPYSYELSHHVQTPIQAGPYYPNGNYYQSELDAIDGAMNALTSFITQAVNQGHVATPTNNWMIPNPDF
jgi:hypothetical protein